MSLNNKLNEIAQYVCIEYPELNFDEVNSGHKCVTDICKTIFKTINSNLKKNIVNGLRRETSELRKRIRLVKENDEPTMSLNDTKVMRNIAKCIEEKKYTRNDFVDFNSSVIYDICRYLKKSKDSKNIKSVYRTCQKIFIETSSFSTCNVNISNTRSDGSGVEGKLNININNLDLLEKNVAVDYDNVLSLKSNDLYATFDNSVLNIGNKETECVSDITITSANFENVVNSTPIPNKSYSATPPLRRSGEKYLKVDTPLKEALLKTTPVKSGVVLPPGAENKYPDTASYRKNSFRVFSGCTYREGQFMFTEQEWSLIEYVNEKGNIRLETTKFPIMLRKRIRTVNNTCVMNVRSVNYPKSSYCHIYMYCSHPGCKSFKLIVEPQVNRSVLIAVWSTSLHYYHNPDYALTNHVRGIERNLVRETLKKTKVFTFDDEAVKSASPSKHARGNNQKVKSVAVLRRIRSEAISADDYDRDDMVDMLLMYSENSNYIKHVGLPSYVHCYSDEQLALLTKVKSKCRGTITGYLDATGTVVRKASDDSKRVLYYAVVVNAPLPGKSSITCPIVEMISSSHDIVAISQWLNAFKAFVLRKKLNWPLFTNVVTDFSYAQMHALCIGWNGFSSIFDYLNWCYTVLFEAVDGSNMTIINVCVNHYTKIIVNHVYTYFKVSSDLIQIVKQKCISNCVIDWICIMFNMDTMEDIIQWFISFAVILLSQTKNKEMKCAFTTLQNKCKENSLLSYDVGENDCSFSDIDKVLCETSTRKSMLYCRFQQIKEKIKNRLVHSSTVSNESNEYFNEEYIESFILKCVPFIPLWTPVMNTTINNGVSVRQSNATVESWFKTVKIDMLEGNRRLKCGRFVTTLRNRVINVCKQVELGIRKKRCTRVLSFQDQSPNKKVKKVHKMSNESYIQNKRDNANETFLDSVEAWGKKEKQHKHLQPKSYRPFKKSQLENSSDAAKRFVVSDKKLGNKIQNDNKNLLEGVCLVKDNNDTVKISFSTPGSHKSPFNVRHSNGIELHSNMLPKDLTYYRHVKMPKTNNYIVGLYDYICKRKNGDLFFPQLLFNDFNTLTKTAWLNNFVIDLCLVSKVIELGLQNVEVWPCELVSCLMAKKDVGEDMDRKIIIEENGLVVLPWNVNGNHWIVAIVDFSTNQCMIMDPMKPVDIDNRINENRFKDLCKGMKNNCVYGDKKDFPLLNLISCPKENIPVQTDGYNCGVFVIYYVFTIISKSQFDPDFNPTEYRIYLKKYLLENSEDITNVCLYCNSLSNRHRCEGNQSVVEWVSCTRCCRWIAINCIPEEDRIDDYESSDFLCLLCQ